ncbi:nitric oxide synthase oxygenase [Streptacidiphilus pinicola]|uniref:Nitric oxide synthase oxygenase n=1 Tax=Streptacidiphilus pinicola TaxID=2219663 RepID=A0A2X0IUQ5_9ACTN|nr:nitric oxide synthase oxygenase [Streptacidiphilus pinicola]RAG81306.1 nitric oxide synthase oxygenase [Streptacidiphilus pinicola]
MTGREPGQQPLLEAAESFVRDFAREHPGAVDPDVRIKEIAAAVDRDGTYAHTPEELTYGARVAWRNAARCIGRLYWNNLLVRDLRHLTHPDDIARECFEHLRLATNGGRIRPVISVFAPDAPGRPAARMLGEQLVRYADDPRSAERCAVLRELGWKGGKEPFEVLPLLIQAAPDRAPEFYELPEDAVLEVPLTHPHRPDFAALGLRWYAVPAVADMTLEIGGISYPAAPFNGWYMGTEIGSRNLADADRYNQLPAVAQLFGLDTADERTLWRDRALVELNLAVLHSFGHVGVTIADHHTESTRFLAHVEREGRHGRAVPTDWTWIVPPLSGSATAVFHRYYDPPDPSARPAFLHRRTPWAQPQPAPCPVSGASPGFERLPDAIRADLGPRPAPHGVAAGPGLTAPQP